MGEKRLNKVRTIKSTEMADILEKVSKEIDGAMRDRLFDIWALPDTYSDLRGKLLTDSYRVLRVQRNITEYMRIVSGRYTLNKSLVELTAELEKLCGDIRVMTDRKEIHFTARIPQEKIFIVCDLEKFEVAILSLVLNSIASGDENNRILLKVIVTEKFIKILIRDRGRGMSEEVRAHCTNPFYSYNPGGKEQLGLGITLTRYFMLESGGRINIKSK